MKTAILIDTGANVLDIKDDNVYFVPIQLIVKEHQVEQQLKDVIDVSQEQLKQILINKTSIHTSLPSPGFVMNKLDELFTKYDRVVILTLSSGLSSYFESLSIIKEDYKDKHLVCIDSRSVSIGILWLVDEINSLLKNNPSDEELIALVKERSQKIIGGVIVNNLDQLIAGGRVKKTKGIIAKALRLKLIVRWNGQLDFMDKTPNLSIAIDKLLDIINDQNQWCTNGIKNIVILTDLENESQINSLKTSLQEKIQQDVEIKVSYLPGCIYAHVGLNNFAILIEAN
ncbi:DegV family protein [Ureaplasma urealyticum]|uniref:DegV family protein n=1 Tax=Ureaplasma urealyticum TaxID=2130 RepID=UPI00307D2ACB